MKYRVKKICINKKSKGLTLIELIVAMGIFSVIIVIVVGLFVATLKGYRKSAALQNVQENARFLMDFMTKEIRQSTIISGDNHSLILERPDPSNPPAILNITYNFDGTNIQRTVAGSPSSSGAINSQQVMVSGAFFISGTTGGTGADSFQPRVTISIKVQTQATKAEERAAIDLQATLSQRILDI
jgi:prepilin-type N-terminal cleavage/methylation domain-containing protein